MGNIQKRIVLDESTERVFQYASEPQSDTYVWPDLLGVCDVHWLIDGVSYMNQIYTLINRPPDGPNIQLDFELDQSTLTTRLREFDLVMTWTFQSDQAAGPHLTIDGDHTYWSQC